MDVSMEETTSALSQNGAQLQLPPPVPSSSTQAYRYSPLKHEHDIRLLYLLPGSNEAPLSCSLRIVSLSEIPDYEAVSYTWGEPIFSASIECFSKGQLPITENLSKALYHLRLANRSRILWIDAICINQQDLVERSHQVTLLRDTFQKAKNVVVWLGEDTGDANEAFEILRAIDPSSSSDVDIMSLVSADRHGALENLLGRSWFRRIWVVQELICAQKAIITCGNLGMEWERFLDVARRIKENGDYSSIRDQSVYDAFFILSCIRLRRRRQEQGGKDELEKLLYNYRSCLASDPRDKVFALVGIARGQIAPAYTPDYAKGVLEVYRDLAMHFIIAEQNPDLLVHCAYIVWSKSPLLPSWVPDWSQELYFNCSPMVCPGAYEASAGTSFRGRVSGNLDELFLDGVLVNKVDTIGGAWFIGDLNDTKRLIEFHEVSIDMFRQSPRYRACYWSAFTRALVADRDHSGDRLGQRDLGEVYVAFRKLMSWRLVGQITSHTSRLNYRLMVCNSLESRDYEPALDYFEAALDLAAYGRVFCMFDDGRAGWVPVAAEVGDQIAIFLGATVPILLRPRGNGYIVLGEAYVNEMMDGQAFEGQDLQVETITLV